MFLIGNNSQQLLNLRYTEHLWQLMCFAGIKCSGHNEGRRIHMLKVKTAGLRHLVAFFTPHAMLPDDKTDVVDNVLLGDCGRGHIIIMGK